MAPHGNARASTYARPRRAVPALAAVLVAVGVVVAGVAVLRPRSAPAPVGAKRAAAPTRQLIDALGVLRRHQTRADLLIERPTGAGGLLPGYFGFARSAACRGPNPPVLLCSVRLDKPLIRSVSVRAYRVGIFPANSTESPRRLSSPGVGVVMALHGPGIYYADSGPRLTSVATLRRQGLIVSAYVASGVDRGVVLVPDGVARVALGSFRLVDPWRRPEGGSHRRHERDGERQRRTLPARRPHREGAGNHPERSASTAVLLAGLRPRLPDRFCGVRAARSRADDLVRRARPRRARHHHPLPALRWYPTPGSRVCWRSALRAAPVVVRAPPVRYTF